MEKRKVFSQMELFKELRKVELRLSNLLMEIRIYYSQMVPE